MSSGSSARNPGTFHSKVIHDWNVQRRGEIELDAVARTFLSDSEITDRDRIAFALRELRRHGYDVNAVPVDWTKEHMIRPLADSEWQAFGPARPSRRYRRLEGISRRTALVEGDGALEQVLSDLYPNHHLLWDMATSDTLAEPYEFDFKGDAGFVEALFQAVGFETQYGVAIAEDESDRHHFVRLRRHVFAPGG